MKWFILSVLTSQPALGEMPKASCNQLVYDQIYETLIQQTIKTEDYRRKADAVELLKRVMQ